MCEIMFVPLCVKEGSGGEKGIKEILSLMEKSVYDHKVECFSFLWCSYSVLLSA